MTEIVNEFPPNYKEIAKTFDLSGREIFAYDGKIYNPGGFQLTPALIAHEEVHFKQQGRSPKRWWKRYLKDPAWRLEQELEAHRVEYRVYNGNRNQRAQYLLRLAQRLASKTYGNMITVQEAMRAIRN